VQLSDLQLELTSFSCQVINNCEAVLPTDQLSAKLHHWDTLLYIGLFTAKVRTCLGFVELTHFCAWHTMF